MTVHTAVPVTHAQAVAPPPLAARAVTEALDMATEQTRGAVLSAVRQRWARRIRAAANDVRPLCTPAVTTALDAFTEARLAENEDDDDALAPEVIAIRQSHLEELHENLASHPAQTFGDVAAKIALAVEHENGGALLRKERAEAIVAGEVEADRSLYVAANAYLDCLRLADPPPRNMPRVQHKDDINTVLILPERDSKEEWDRAVRAYNAAAMAYAEATDDNLLEGLLDELQETMERVFDTAAPDVFSLALKQRLIAFDKDDRKLGFESVAFCLACRDGWGDGSAAELKVHIDTLRLAGVTEDPCLDLPDFRPAHWISAMRALGCTVAGPDFKRFEVRGPADEYTAAAIARVTDDERRIALWNVLMDQNHHGFHSSLDQRSCDLRPNQQRQPVIFSFEREHGW